jgi:hypothetical protein
VRALSLVLRPFGGASKGWDSGLELDASLALSLFLVDFLALALVLVVFGWAIVTIVTILAVTFEVLLLLVWLTLIFLFLWAITRLTLLVSPELKLFFLYFTTLQLLLLLTLQVSIVLSSSFVTIPDENGFFFSVIDHRVALIFAETFRSFIRREFFVASKRLHLIIDLKCAFYFSVLLLAAK